MIRDPPDVEIFDSAPLGGPVTRPRAVMHWELIALNAAVGPNWLLEAQRLPIVRIENIMTAVDELPIIAFLDGDLVFVEPEPFVDMRLLGVPVVAAFLTLGGPGSPLFAGSHVLIDGHALTWTVVEITHPAGLLGVCLLKLFDDRPNGFNYLLGVAKERVTSHLKRRFPVLDTRSVACSFTKMSLPPLGSGKQLWLRSGRATIVQPDELLRLHELSDHSYDSLRSTKPVDINKSASELAGVGISMRLADAMALRSLLRARMFCAIELLQLHVAAAPTPDPAHLEVQLVRRAARFSASCTDAPAFLVVVRMGADGALQALVPSDLTRLPTLVRALVSGTDGRSSARRSAETFMQNVTNNPDIHAFLAHDNDSFTIVTVPMFDYSPTPLLHSFAVWAELVDLAGYPIYAPVAFAFSLLATLMKSTNQSLGLLGTRGARPPRPMMPQQLRSTPGVPEHALTQLRICERTDYLLQQHIAFIDNPITGVKLSSQAEKLFFEGWLDRIDCSANASVPASLLGNAHVYADPMLAGLSFPDQGGIPSLPRFKPKPPQTTTYRPTNIRMILDHFAIRLIAAWLKSAVSDLRAMAQGRPARTLSTLVIGQNHVLPPARGIIWDTEKLHFDRDDLKQGYFKPVDFEAPLGTHLNTKFLFEQIGDDYPDQELRHMLVDGFQLKIDPSLQIVLSPHLLSLAGIGFEKVDKELRRLASKELGYLKVVRQHAGHSCDLASDCRIVLALGRIPFRAQAQGAVARTLDPLRPRRIEDGGQPRKEAFDDEGNQALPLNVMLRKVYYSKEKKATVPQAMQADAILQYAGRIYGQPVLGWSDDMSDCFNQLFWAPSETWLMTIVWLMRAAFKTDNLCDNDVDFIHALERGMGFGIRCTSNYAQRISNALLCVFERVFLVDEDRRNAEETDPARRAYLR